MGGIVGSFPIAPAIFRHFHSRSRTNAARAPQQNPALPRAESVRFRAGPCARTGSHLGREFGALAPWPGVLILARRPPGAANWLPDMNDAQHDRIFDRRAGGAVDDAFGYRIEHRSLNAIRASIGRDGMLQPVCDRAVEELRTLARCASGRARRRAAALSRLARRRTGARAQNR